MIMKKLFTFIAVAAFALSMQASIYIVGNEPFGGWNTASGAEMTDNGDGTYTLTAHINESIWFVFATGLTETSDDWDTFNTQYRYGPATGSDQTVEVNEWMDTQPQGNGNGAYMLIVPEGGSDYTFTFDEYSLQFMVEGEEGDDGFHSFTVAGTPVSVFGTEWDPSNTANDMVKNADGLFVLDKYSCQLPEGDVLFKVAANHAWAFAWPADNYQLYIDAPGIYDIHITFDSVTCEVSATAEVAGELPPARTDDVFILGEVNGNGWAPNVGVMMSTDDKNIYTAQVEATGANDGGDGIAYSYFSFTSKLAETDDWSSIALNRLGALEDGYQVSDDMMGMELGLAGFGTTNSFRVPSGSYTLTVNLDNMTLVVTKGGDAPKPGDVNGDGEVNIGDLNAVIALILSNSYTVAGDVNNDSEVNIGDINAIINIILAKPAK